jgi:hypothetical protein
MRLREMEPAVLDGLLQDLSGAAEGVLSGNPAPVVAALPPGAPVDPSVAPPCTIREKFWSAGDDPLLLHYGTFLPPFEGIYPGHEAARFSNVLSLTEAKWAILVVGIMRNNASKLVPLWGPAQHLDPPYNHTSTHKAYVLFCPGRGSGEPPFVYMIRL